MNRRTFLRKTALAGTVELGLRGWRPGHALAEPPPETTRIRLAKTQAMCIAPQYVAEQFLPAEGFTDVQYVTMPGASQPKAVAAGEIDIALNFTGPLITRVDAGDRIVILAGIHVGCFELFGSERIRAIRDLRGKTVAVSQLGGPEHVFLASMVAYVGLDPRNDVRWVTNPFEEAANLLAEGKIDALLGFPPHPQELRARKIGRMVVNSLIDRPWSQYFCCMAIANREFARAHPAATKRALRAILKAGALCSLDPQRAARFLVDGGYTKVYEYALETMKDLGYDRWREYDAEDTIRFYALRLQEAGMIRATPQRIIAQGTDWRFLNELKKELKS